MKKLLILFLFPLCVQAQQFPTDEKGNVVYTEVIEIEGAKDDLFVRANSWFAETFKSANDVIQLRDKEAGIITGKGLTYIQVVVIGVGTKVTLHFTVNVGVKEGRYKYEIKDLTYEDEYGQAPAEKVLLSSKTGKVVTQYKEKTDQAVKDIIASLKAAMAEPVGMDSDW